MKKKIEQEEAFFSQVEEVLQAHEDAYEAGAWEEFVATKKKAERKRPIYGWIAAAAVLLLLSFGLFEITRKDQLQKEDVVVKNNPEQPSTPDVTDLALTPQDKSTAFEERRANDHARSSNAFTPGEKVVRNADNQGEIIIASVNSTKHSDNATVRQDTAVATPLFNKERKNAAVVAGAYDSLMNQNRVAKTDEKDSKRLTYSLVVSPSISNQKVNFGAGMELYYKIGQHLSVSSGLMYTAIGAKSDGTTLVNANNARAQDANLAVRGIEIPLGIQYQTKGGFYAAAGVSALGLIKDKLEYSYLAEGLAADVQYSAGLTNEVLKVVNEKQTQESIEPLNNYMGFFNFSAGKKQAIGNVNFNIGPFVKVPFSSVSSEKIKLLQGGVKVSVDF